VPRLVGYSEEAVLNDSRYLQAPLESSRRTLDVLEALGMPLTSNGVRRRVKGE